MTTRRAFVRNASLTVGSFAIAPTAFKTQKQRLGVALVGLGNYSKTMLGPALKETKNCYLSGIVTGTPSKAVEWAKEFNIPDKNVYNYDNYDDIANNPAIDIIYVVLPNSMHAEYSIRALEAGKHVICEKPMAMDAVEASGMMEAAEKSGKRLAIGYRMHYDPYFIEVKRLGQQKILGSINYMETSLGYVYSPPAESWKMKKAMGGGPIYNLGVYPIQSARHTKGAEPTHLTAQVSTVHPTVYTEVHETCTWQLEWSDGTICSSYVGAAGRIDRLFAACQNGHILLNPATAYTGQAGESSQGKFDYPQVFQQKLQIEDFANCIIQDIPSIVSGRDGYLDMLIIDTIYRSIESGRREEIGP